MKLESGAEEREQYRHRYVNGSNGFQSDEVDYLVAGRYNTCNGTSQDSERAISNCVSPGTDGQTPSNLLSVGGFFLGNGSKGIAESKNFSDTDISRTSQIFATEYKLVNNIEQRQQQETRANNDRTIQLPLGQPTTNLANIGSNIDSSETITSQSLWLPVTPSRDFHESSATTTSTSRVDTQQPRPAQTFATEGTQSYLVDNFDNIEAFHRLNMGYSNHGDNSWRAAQDSSTEQTKMDSLQPQQQQDVLSVEHERKERDDDSTTVRSAETASLGSPSHGSLQGGPIVINNAALGVQFVATTPSTVSTASSTIDEVSLGALDQGAIERLAFRGDALDSNAALFYRRGTTWENLPYQSQMYVPDETDHGAFSRALLPPSQTVNNAWMNPHSNQRIASFRHEQGYAGSPYDSRWQQQQRYDAHLQHGSIRNVEPRAYAQVQSPHYTPYHAAHRQHGQLPPVTPPRAARPQNRPSPAPTSATQPNQIQTGPSSGNSRSPSEVLKTLLRKKACLYEPDTSRAVALATWLVGRELALEFGYFSRQQLQAGVHACVAGKIDSGVITRTKVNRCMQIILNSCFHYIIPRPDGTEENGDVFRFIFKNEVTDDSGLLRQLPAPWNDLSIDRDMVLEASLADLEGKPFKSEPSSEPSTPQASPSLGSIPVEKTSPRPSKDEDGDSKRAVLLCFNENVRCAEDVFRCHNEFIRDTSHASGLQLSSHEWRSFFGKEAAGWPNLWGNVGIPVPRLEGSHQVDALGVMTSSELAKFRTSWCAKRYDHDHELCGFAHVDVNGGWLRRHTQHHNYGMEMCPEITRFSLGRNQGNRKYVVNACPLGVDCGYAHSTEEIMYHPRRYKSFLCSSLTRAGGCPNGDVCPDFHPADTYKFPAKKGEGRLGSRQQRQGPASAKGAVQPPSAAPILYCSPAPVSRFEEQFQMPGLKNLYRRHCSVMRAYLRNPGSCVCCYSCFGDDSGTEVDPSSLSEMFKRRGLPQARGV